MEFNKRNYFRDNDREDGRNNNRDNNRDADRNNSGGGFRERSFDRDNRNSGGGGFRERSFDNRDNRDGGGFRDRSFNQDNRDAGGGFRKEFRRDDRPPRPMHELVHSTKFRAGKRRTYFFDVRKTENGDHYVTVTESTQRMNGGYDRHKMFLYKEDFNRFVREISTVVEHIKTDLQPEYDYDEFERRQLEWEEQRRLELENGTAEAVKEDTHIKDEIDAFDAADADAGTEDDSRSRHDDEDEDMSW